MPNWVKNTVVVRGDPKELARFAKRVKGTGQEDGNPFSLHSVVPMPQELRDIHTGSTEIDGVRYHRWREIDGKDVGITPEEEDALKEKYGHADWYDWAYANWGTKWDTGEGGYEVAVGVLTYRFDTAWSPPEPVANILEEEFPDLFIEWTFLDEYDGFEETHVLLYGKETK